MYIFQPFTLLKRPSIYRNLTSHNLNLLEENLKREREREREREKAPVRHSTIKPRIGECVCPRTPGNYIPWPHLSLSPSQSHLCAPAAAFTIYILNLFIDWADRVDFLRREGELGVTMLGVCVYCKLMRVSEWMERKRSQAVGEYINQVYLMWDHVALLLPSIYPLVHLQQQLLHCRTYKEMWRFDSASGLKRESKHQRVSFKIQKLAELTRPKNHSLGQQYSRLFLQ